MKTRVTFIRDGASDWDPTVDLKLHKRKLDLHNLEASVREDQLTWRADELSASSDLWKEALAYTERLHIRWQSPRAIRASDPYASRVVPGLHVSFLPLKSQDPDKSLDICRFLAKVFSGITKCKSSTESFTISSAPHKDGGPEPLLEYYQLLPNIDSLDRYVSDTFCSKDPKTTTSKPTACQVHARYMTSADVFDFDYSVDSATIVVRSIKYNPRTLTDETIIAHDFTRVEVGVLTSDDSAPGLTSIDEAHQKMGMAGLVSIIGENEKPSPVLFSFPSRYRVSEDQYGIGFDVPTGLHPTLRFSFPANMSEPSLSSFHANSGSGRDELQREQCNLYASVTLPSYLFPDKYQLAAPNFLAANNLGPIRSLTDPPPDLEAPDWAIKSWGSNMLIELVPPSASAGSPSWSAKLPLHLRYLEPSAGGQQNVSIAWPTVFWACSNEDSSKESPGINPFERRSPQLDAVFSSDTTFHYLTPTRSLISPLNKTPNTNSAVQESELLIENISVPVLNTQATGYASLRDGTAAVIVLGFAWVMWKLAYVGIARRGATGVSRLAQRDREETKDEKKD